MPAGRLFLWSLILLPVKCLTKLVQSLKFKVQRGRTKTPLRTAIRQKRRTNLRKGRMTILKRIGAIRKGILTIPKRRTYILKRMGTIIKGIAAIRIGITAIR